MDCDDTCCRNSRRRLLLPDPPVSWQLAWCHVWEIAGQFHVLGYATSVASLPGIFEILAECTVGFHTATGYMTPKDMVAGR